MGRAKDAATIGSRIRTRRIERGLTQAQVGEPRFTSAYISLIECGHRSPSEDTLAFIAERLELRLDELLTGTPPGLEASLELRLHEARREIDRGRTESATQTAMEVLEEAALYKLKRVEARASETLAAIREVAAGPAAALGDYHRAEELWSSEPIHLRVEAVIGIAHCTRSLGNPQMAVHTLDSYRRELISSRHPHPLALMRTYTEMVYGYFAVGLPEKASEAAREALLLGDQVENPEDLACMYLTVARSLLYEREFADALGSIRRAEEIYLSGGWRNKAAKARIAEGIVLSKKGDFESAQERLLSALELLHESPHPLDEAIALNELGRVTRHLGDPPTALVYLERALPRLQEADALQRASNRREAGLCLREIDPEGAKALLEQAIDLYRISNFPDEVAATYKALGDIYIANGKLDLALSAFREGIEVVENRPSG